MQRLKDKLGGRCLASSEVEYDHLPARILGEEGRGTAFVVEQLIWTRLDTLTAVAGHDAPRRRRGDWHARHRTAFGAPLARQPAMVNVLADIALESEAATVSALRIARAFDSDDPAEAAFRRLALAVMKYWVCKRGAPLAAEALECLGGNGYVEEAPMAQFYRDIQIGTVWEGSGNVIALDVLRALSARAGGASGVPGANVTLPPAAIRALTPTWCAFARARRAGRGSRGGRMERSPRRRGHGARAAGQPAPAPRAGGRLRRVLRRTPRGARSRVRRPPPRRRRRSDRRARFGAVASTNRT